MSTLGRAAHMAGQRAATGQAKPQVPHCTLGELARSFPLTYMTVYDSWGKLVCNMSGRELLEMGSQVAGSKVKSMFPYILGIEYPAIAFSITLNNAF